MSDASLQMLRGYEAKAEEILSYSRANGPHSWQEVRNELAGDVDEDEFPLLAQLMGFQDGERGRSVSFDDWRRLFESAAVSPS